MVHQDAAPGDHRRLRLLPITAAVVGAVFTILIASVPAARFAYENLTLHAATDHGDRERSRVVREPAA